MIARLIVALSLALAASGQSRTNPPRKPLSEDILMRVRPVIDAIYARGEAVSTIDSGFPATSSGLCLSSSRLLVGRTEQSPLNEC